MDIKNIDELIAKMEENQLKRLVIKKGDFEVELEKQCAGHVAMTPPAAPVVSMPAPAAAVVPSAPPPAAEGQKITSPIVGTFYSASSPDDPPYVKVGDLVEPETIVCIVEAMKVMNEVKAGVRGKVVELLMKNGDPVEFGTALFRVE